MLDAAYKAVEAVRTNHPDIPEVLVVLGALSASVGLNVT
jgi:hypothetical protein